MLLECKQRLLELIDGCRNREAQVVEPFLIDEAHIADRLDRRLALAELLDPRKRPDVSVRVRAHLAVLRVLVEDLLQVRHIFVDIILQRKDQLLLPVLQKVAVTEARRENEVRQSREVDHLQRDLVAPLIRGNGCPVDMHVGLLLEPLEDGPLVRIRFRTARIAGQTCDSLLLLQRELHAVRICGSSCIDFISEQGRAAAGQGRDAQSHGSDCRYNTLFHSHFTKTSLTLDRSDHDTCVKMLLEEREHDEQRNR